MPTSGIEITPDLTIPFSELSFETSPSSGPGGQHVNRTETRVTAVFDVAASRALSEEQRALILEQLGGRISKSGELRVSVQDHRSQKTNREKAVERLADLLRDALAVRPERKPTRVPARAKRKRLDTKRRTSEKKRSRRRPDLD